MIPIAWVESAGLGTNATDTAGVLRHTWQVVYRCPGCPWTGTERFTSRTLNMNGDPAPVVAAEVSDALARLIVDHTCPQESSC